MGRAVGDLVQESLGRGPCLENSAFGAPAILLNHRAFGEGEAAFTVAADQTLAPRLAAANQLPDGQGVDELVGEKDQRASGQLVEARVPAQRHRRILQCLPLRLGHHGARLDQRDGNAVDEIR